jgi:hypothetical protein
MKVRELAGSTRAISIFGDGTTPVRPRGSFGSPRSESHMLDNVIGKLRAFDFRGAFHQTREIVSDALAGDGAV